MSPSTHNTHGGLTVISIGELQAPLCCRHLNNIDISLIPTSIIKVQISLYSNTDTSPGNYPKNVYYLFYIETIIIQARETL